jgi:predicted RNA-binding protein YlxR (DUF448 family)
VAKQRKIPIRKCLATNESFSKQDLFRIVRTPEGEVLIDDNGKANGRGAYISKSREAIIKAKQKAVLDRHLEVKVPDDIYEKLMNKLGDE